MPRFQFILRAVLVMAMVVAFGVAVLVVLGQYPQRYDIPLSDGRVYHNRHAFLFNTVVGRCMLTAAAVFVAVSNGAVAWFAWQNWRRKPHP